MKVGERIKSLRESENLTQNALAEKSGISQSHLRRVELGQTRITTDNLELICDALNITMGQFFEPTKNEDELGLALSKLTPKQKDRLLEFIKTL